MATTKATTLAHRTIPTSAITSGTFADARIAVSNVTQHEGSIDALASNPTITLGSNATFPAGHIVTRGNIEGEGHRSGADVSTSNTTFTDINIQTKITAKYPSSGGSKNSKILIRFYSAGWGGTTTNQDLYMTFCRYSTQPDSTKTYATSDDIHQPGSNPLYNVQSSPGTSKQFTYSYQGFDEQAHSAQDYWYRAFFRVGGGNAIRIMNQYAPYWFWAEELLIN